jgi:hypothetical protein
MHFFGKEESESSSLSGSIGVLFIIVPVGGYIMKKAITWIFVVIATLMTVGNPASAQFNTKRYIVSVRDAPDTGIIKQKVQRLGHTSKVIGKNTVLIVENSRARGGRPNLLDSLLDVKRSRRTSGGTETVVVEEDTPSELILPMDSDTSASAPLDAAPGWNLTMTGAPIAWRLGATGEGIVVASIDGGGGFNHPGLDLLGGWVSIFNTPDVTAWKTDPNCNGHGTHVSGTMHGKLSTGVGMAPLAKGVQMRVFEFTSCVAYTSSTIRGINYAASTYNARVFNVSIGHGGSFSGALVVNQMRAENRMVCGANGNDGAYGAFWPASDSSAVGVAAVDGSNNRASWSRTGPTTDFSAPGVGINSTMPGGGYGTKSGTSMAAPHVCGAIAQLMSLFPTLPVDSLIKALKETAIHGSPNPNDQIGYGLIQVHKAVAYLKGGVATDWTSKIYPAGTVVDSVLMVCSVGTCTASATGGITILRQGLYTVFSANGPGAISITQTGGTPTPPPPPPPPPVPTATAIISVDTLVKYQTISGWEAHSQAGQESVGFSGFQSEVMDSAVAIGLNRIRLEIQSGIENPVDYYTQYRAGTITHQTWKANWYVWVNDNSDPNSTNPAGYQWSRLDDHIETTIIPMRQRLAARGESLFVNLNYVSFAQGQGQSDPNEYAELILATFQHMQSKYGFVPNAVEMILEPDNNTIWNGTKIGQALAATGPRLSAAGFYPEFIAPSTMSMAQAVPYLDAIVAVPGALPYLKEVSYHRYSGVSDAALAGIASRATTLGLRTSMLEHIGSGLGDLYADLTIGNVSSWQQFTIAFPTTDNGAQYFTITNNRPVSGSRTPALSQVFRYVRSGARRVNATSTNSVVRPVAFTNVGGAPVVVMISQDNQIFEIRGLRPGTYAITTDNQYARTLPDATAGADGILRFSSGVWGTYTLVWKTP